jgi:hypothetical protein
VLSHPEALVLYERLTRFNESGESSFEDQAEQRVLFDLEASLEKIPAEPFAADYQSLLRRARDAVRDENDDS